MRLGYPSSPGGGCLIEFIKKAGTGIKRIRDDVREQGCPEPEFEANGFFTVIFRPNPDVRAQIAEDVGGQVTDQVGGQVTPEVTPEVAPESGALCSTPRMKWPGNGRS